MDGDENHVTGGLGYGSKTRFDATVDRGERSTRLLFGVTTAF